jgi:hypothetical protein
MCVPIKPQIQSMNCSLFATLLLPAIPYATAAAPRVSFSLFAYLRLSCMESISFIIPSTNQQTIYAPLLSLSFSVL